MRARIRRRFEAIIDNAEIGEEQKQQAVNEMIQLTDLSEKEVAVGDTSCIEGIFRDGRQSDGGQCRCGCKQRRSDRC